VNVVFSTESPTNISGDILAICVSSSFENDLKGLDSSFDGHLISYLKSSQFKGETGNTAEMPSFGKTSAPSLLLLGVGDGSQENLIRAAAQAGRKARARGAKALVLAADGLESNSVALALEAIQFGNYEYQVYKPSSDQKSVLESVVVAGVDSSATNSAAAVRANIRAKQQSFARDLVNGPAADVTPSTLADSARTLALIDGVTVEVWDFQRCIDEGLVGLVAVGQGSAEPGCLIHVRYRPPQANGHVALVGKGVTFDCGGLSIKPAGGMQTMRMDMGGSATVLGAIGTAAELGLPINVDCFVGAVENMINGNSYKQGDILRYSNGVTVEIHNTDAEGRLVLADCLIQACKVEGVTHIIDAATLTGACIVALGDELTALFTKEDDLANDLLTASKYNDEGMWRLPLKQSYKRSIKATWGQIKNVGSRSGGSITAALFLQHFVTDDVKWAHLDIAGAAWYDKPIDAYAAGATGQGVRTLATWIEEMAKA
jgi:leucyl aminopeptidase